MVIKCNAQLKNNIYTSIFVEVNFVIINLINLMDNKCSRDSDIYLGNIVNNTNIAWHKLNPDMLRDKSFDVAEFPWKRECVGSKQPWWSN